MLGSKFIFGDHLKHWHAGADWLGHQDNAPAAAANTRYVVHEPVIGGATRDIPAAAELLHTTLARQYWNPTGDFGREMSKALNFWKGHR